MDEILDLLALAREKLITAMRALDETDPRIGSVTTAVGKIASAMAHCHSADGKAKANGLPDLVTSEPEAVPAPESEAVTSIDE